MTTAQPGSPLPPASAQGAESAPGADRAGGILAVYAHPDDETLQAGGLLALAAQVGERVSVVTATRGERGELIGAEHLQGSDAVAPLRERELADALAALGVTEHHFLDTLAERFVARSGADSGASPRGLRWVDSGMTWLGPRNAGPASDAPDNALSRGAVTEQALALAGLMRDLRPRVVLCDEPGGAYGHPDHVRTHDLTVAAVELAADDDAPLAGDRWPVPVLAHVVHRADRLRAAHAAVAAGITELGAMDWRGEPLTIPAPDAPLPALARAEDQPDLPVVAVDVTPVAPQVLAALRCYPSQVQAATIPALDRGRVLGKRHTPTLRPTQAAIGWYALSNAEAAPILPVVELELAAGTAGELPFPAAVSAVTPAPLESPSPPQTATRTLVARFAVGLVLGVLAAGMGTLLHRLMLGPVPAGMVLGVALVVLGTLAARGLTRGAGLAGCGLGVIATVQLLTFVGRAGDVLVPADTLGTAWLLLSVLSLAVAAFLPRRWTGEDR